MSNEGLKTKQQELENKNSIKAEKRVDKAFQLFLNEAGAPNEEYQFFEEDELANWLTKFWFGARTRKKEDFYTINSLKSFKYWINYILIKHSHAFNITKSPSFWQCMKDFDLVCLKLKQNGKGFIKNYKEIEDEGKYKPFYTIFNFKTLNLVIFYMFN